MKTKITIIALCALTMGIAFAVGCKKEKVEPQIAIGQQVGNIAHPQAACNLVIVACLLNPPCADTWNGNHLVWYGCGQSGGKVASGALLPTSDFYPHSALDSANYYDIGVGMRFDFMQNNTISYTLFANSAGQISYSDMIPGTYDIVASLEGYSSYELKDYVIPDSEDAFTGFMIVLDQD